MFQELKELSKKATLKLTITSDHDGQMNVLLELILKDKEDKSLNLPPLIFNDSADKLDETFSAQVIELTSKVTPIVEQIDVLTNALKSSLASVTDEALGKKETKVKASTTAKKEEPATPDLFATATPKNKEIKGASLGTKEVIPVINFEEEEEEEEDNFEIEEMTTNEIIEVIEKETKPQLIEDVVEDDNIFDTEDLFKEDFKEPVKAEELDPYKLYDHMTIEQCKNHVILQARAKKLNTDSLAQLPLDAPNMRERLQKMLDIVKNK